MRLCPYYAMWAHDVALPLATLPDDLCRANSACASVRQTATLALMYLEDVAHYIAAGREDTAQRHLDMAESLADEALRAMAEHADAWLDDQTTHP